MKRNLLIYLFFVLTLISVTKSQTISQEQKDSVIAQLNAEKNSTLYYATRTIITYDIYEAIPVLKEKIWEKEVEPRLYFLEALVALNAPAVSDYVLAFWDTLNNNIYNDVDSVSIRLNILLLLFQLNDYSEANYVFNVLSDTASYSLYNENIIDLLWFLLNSSIYEAAAKDKLIYFLNESTNREERSKALYWLDEKYGEDISSYVISRFHEDEDFSIRWSILYNILPKYNDNLVSEILKEKLVTEPDTLIRRQIARYILDSLGIPSNYKYIIDWLEDESSDIKLKEIIKRQFETVRPFIPFKPDISTTINTIIDSTVSYINQGENFGWVADDIFILELQSILLSAKTALQNGDSLACAVQLKSFQDSVDFVYADSLNTDPRFVTIEGWKFLYWNAQYILDRLPEPQTNPNLVVNLKNSLGNQIPASNVKYYDTSWKDAIDNGDGTFTVITTKPTVSVRVFYEYANQTVNNVPAQNNTYTFTTVNAAVQLKNSLGNLIDQGTVQYYAGAWRSFGTTSNGVANKELLPINYSFRMTYEFGSIDKQQNLSVDPTVVFQTVNAAVQLKNSLGNLIDQGTVQYYAGAWRSFGTTTNGVATKELLPVNYSFRMTHEFVSNDKQQNLSTDSTVIFSTVLCTVKVTNANNQPLENAETKYYSVAWRDIGQTNAEGIITKELLPKNLSFRAISGNVSQDKQQDIGVNSTVEIQLNLP